MVSIADWAASADPLLWIWYPACLPTMVMVTAIMAMRTASSAMVTTISLRVKPRLSRRRCEAERRLIGGPAGTS